MAESIALAVIGGSGFYDMPLADVRIIEPDTPYGPPSAAIHIGFLEDTRVAFLARHGTGHTITPSEVNQRANFWALKFLGVERVLGVSAIGSLREDYAPGDMVVPDQLVDPDTWIAPIDVLRRRACGAYRHGRAVLLITAGRSREGWRER